MEGVSTHTATDGEGLKNFKFDITPEVNDPKLHAFPCVVAYVSRRSLIYIYIYIYIHYKDDIRGTKYHDYPLALRVNLSSKAKLIS